MHAKYRTTLGAVLLFLAPGIGLLLWLVFRPQEVFLLLSCLYFGLITVTGASGLSLVRVVRRRAKL